MVLNNSAYEIRDQIKDFTPDQLAFSMQLTSDDANATKLVRWYERLILLCSMDFKRYYKIKLEEHIKIADFIEKNDLYHCWAELIPYIAQHSDTDKFVNMPLVALLSELGDTWLVFSKENGTMVCGITRDGKSLLTTKDRYYGWADKASELAYKLEQGKISDATFRKKLPSVLHKDAIAIEQDERAVNRTIFNFIPYINEKTYKVLPQNWVDHNNFTVYPVRPYFSNGDAEFVKMLIARKYMLSSKGVLARLKNAGNIRDMFFMEDLTSSGMFYVIYKVTFLDGKETCGFIIPSIPAYSCGFQDEHNRDAIIMLALEIYCDLTCDFPKEIKRKYALKEVDTFEDISLNSTNLYVIYEEDDKTKENKGGTRLGTPQKRHHRSQSVRKLAEGKEVSEIAKQRALEHGIVLQPGETYVRPYFAGGSAKVRKEISTAKSKEKG
jgi:hypothetical protein